MQQGKKQSAGEAEFKATGMLLTVDCVAESGKTNQLSTKPAS
jgi:hypothetical protein